MVDCRRCIQSYGASVVLFNPTILPLLYSILRYFEKMGRSPIPTLSSSPESIYSDARTCMDFKHIDPPLPWTPEAQASE